jgi:hypothetical protein
MIALQKLKQNETEDSNLDPLDAYMSTLESSTYNKTEIREMKMELLHLQKEKMQLLKLINLTKPAYLPLLKPHISSSIKKTKNNLRNLKSVIGKRKKHKSSSEVRVNNISY